MQGQTIAVFARVQALPVERIAGGRGRDFHELPGSRDGLAAERELETAVRTSDGLRLVGAVTGNTKFSACQGITGRIEHAAADDQQIGIAPGCFDSRPVGSLFGRFWFCFSARRLGSLVLG